MDDHNAIPGEAPHDRLLGACWGPRQVLIVVEMDQASLRALAWGCGLVRATGASLAIATAPPVQYLECGAYGSPLAWATTGGVTANETSEFESEVECIVGGVRSYREYRLNVLSPRKITRTAEDIGADLVVIGCGGQLSSWRRRVRIGARAPLVLIP